MYSVAFLPCSSSFVLHRYPPLFNVRRSVALPMLSPLRYSAGGATRLTPTAITRRLSDIQKYHYPPTVTDKETAKAFRKKQKRIARKREIREKEQEDIITLNRPGAGLNSYGSPYRAAEERLARFDRAHTSEEMYELERRAEHALLGDGPADCLLTLLRARYMDRHGLETDGKEVKLTEDIPHVYKRLIEEILKCDQVYYNNDGHQESRVSDQAYDELVMHLLELERRFPELIAENSPTLNVSHYASEMAVKLGLEEECEDVSKLQKSQFDGHLLGKMDSLMSYSNVVPIEQKRSEGRYRHMYPMLSLNNAYSHDDIVAFWKKIQILGSSDDYHTDSSTASGSEIIAELKIDGVALSLEYRDGKLYNASTRGNGRVGDDITSNISQATIQGIPKEIDTDIGNLVVRGEIYIDKDDFLAINEGLTRKLSNARNAAAGAIQHKDYNEISNRRLKFMAYELLTVDYVDTVTTAEKEDGIEESGNASSSENEKTAKVTSTYSTQYETLINLESLGFGRAPEQYFKVCKSVEEIEAYSDFVENERSSLDFEIDGIVLKYNDADIRFQLGYTSKSPRGAIAYKFTAQSKVTELIDVVYQVSRSGVVTPVAVLEPVIIGGARLSRASLHNFEYIEQKLGGLALGDKVRIERGGDVIPKVTVVESRNSDPTSRKIEMPKTCPVCNAKVEVVENETTKGGNLIYKCTARKTCGAQAHGRILYFVNKQAMDIKGLGSKTVHKLVDKGLVVVIADLFRLTVDDICSLDGYSLPSAQKLINGIEEAKTTRSLHKIIIGLGLPGVGKIGSKDFAKKLQSLDNLVVLAQQVFDNSRKQRSFDETEGSTPAVENDESEYNTIHKESVQLLASIPGVAERSAYALVDYFKSEQNVNELKAIAQHVTPCSILDEDEEENDAQDSNLSPGGGSQKVGSINERTFVFTGKFLTVDRSQIMRYIRKNGGRVTSDVSKKTDFLVHGIEPGQKFFKAQRLNTMLVEENDFLDMFDVPEEDRAKYNLLHAEAPENPRKEKGDKRQRESVASGKEGK